MNKEKCTYKSIVECMVEESAIAWVKEILDKEKIGHTFVDACHVAFEHDNNCGHYMWEVNVSIVQPGPGYRHKYIVVGGTVDDIVGICNSCIWDAEKKKILWMNVEKTRESLGITRFVLPEC